jgi:hypothetical protein
MKTEICSLHFAVLAGLLLPPPALSQTPPTLNLQVTGGVPQLTLTGTTGAVCQLQYLDAITTSNSWLCLTNFVLTASPYTIVDALAPGTTQRFYRALAVSPDLTLVPHRR